MSETVTVDRQAAVATITLSDPDNRNALTHASKEALRDAIADLGADEQIRAVVLAGSDNAFCVGQDLSEHVVALDGGAEEAFATVRDHYSPIVRGLMTMPQPVIAAVTGACVGAGLGFALACDHRVFATGAKLATAFTGIGLTFDSGLSYTLPRAVGDARARELVLYGRTFSAEDAVTWGIAGEIVEPEAVLPRATELAARLAAGPTAAYAASKRLLLDDDALDAALESEADAQTACGATADHADAVAAFMGRETPSFTGH